jgi:hypothetical protein
LLELEQLLVVLVGVVVLVNQETQEMVLSQDVLLPTKDQTVLKITKDFPQQVEEAMTEQQVIEEMTALMGEREILATEVLLVAQVLAEMLGVKVMREELEILVLLEEIGEQVREMLLLVDLLQQT